MTKSFKFNLFPCQLKALEETEKERLARFLDWCSPVSLPPLPEETIKRLNEYIKRGFRDREN